MQRRAGCACAVMAAALLAGCGGSSKASSPGTAQHSTTSTTETAEESSVPVVECRTTFAVATPPSTVSLPATVTVAVPASMAGQFAVYVDTSGITKLLAPKGWTCMAQYAADGSGGVAVYPPGETAPSSSSGRPAPSVSDRAITATETGGSPVQAAAQACAYFSAAAAATESDLGHGCTAPPSGQSDVQLSSNVVAFEDPPGVAGAGSPSGGPYPANGVITYSAATQPGTYIGTCTLPQNQHDVCTVVLDYFASLYGDTRPGVPAGIP